MGHHSKLLIFTLAGLFLLVIITWRMALAPTLQLQKDINQLKNKINQLESAPSTIFNLENALKTIESKVGSISGKGEENDLIDIVSPYLKKNKNVTLYEIFPTHQVENDNYLIETDRFEFQGDYRQLTSFLHELEQQAGIGRIVSTRFFLMKDQSTRQKQLRLMIYLQRFYKKK